MCQSLTNHQAALLAYAIDDSAKPIVDARNLYRDLTATSVSQHTIHGMGEHTTGEIKSKIRLCASLKMSNLVVSL